MPLHLLGKKSWNIYNQDSIARVRRDKAAAELLEKEELRRIDEADAEARLQALRGARYGIHTESQVADIEEKHDQAQRPNKKRKLDSEDTTERGGRLATSSRQKDISLTDKNGHINLIPESETCNAKGNVELAAESRNRQQDFEDLFTMRFSNAAGRNAGPGGPWYNEPARSDSLTTAVLKNVWGNEDPRRREREKRRTAANDPLAMIKKGVKQLREVDEHREKWRAQRERDLNEVEELAKKHKHRRKRRQSDEDILEGFNLDGDPQYDEYQSERQNRKASSDRHRRHHRDGSGSHRNDGGRR